MKACTSVVSELRMTDSRGSSHFLHRPPLSGQCNIVVCTCTFTGAKKQTNKELCMWYIQLSWRSGLFQVQIRHFVS